MRERVRVGAGALGCRGALEGFFLSRGFRCRVTVRSGHIDKRSVHELRMWTLQGRLGGGLISSVKTCSVNAL